MFSNFNRAYQARKNLKNMHTRLERTTSCEKANIKTRTENHRSRVSATNAQRPTNVLPHSLLVNGQTSSSSSDDFTSDSSGSSSRNQSLPSIKPILAGGLDSDDGSSSKQSVEHSCTSKWKYITFRYFIWLKKINKKN